MQAQDVMVGDVLTTESGHWMVREFKRINTSTALPERMEIRLSAGRTDHGDWYLFNLEQEVDIYRPQVPPFPSAG